MMTVYDQARAFAAMAICGACTGAMQDIFAVLRRNMLFAIASDLLLGVLCALGIIGVGLMLRCDPLGLYTVLGMGSGWILYAVSLGTIVRILAGMVTKLSKKVNIRAKNGKFMQENEKLERI